MKYHIACPPEGFVLFRASDVLPSFSNWGKSLADKPVWTIVNEKGLVVTMCLSANTAHFLEAALEDYDGSDFSFTSGIYSDVECQPVDLNPVYKDMAIGRKTWNVTHKDGHVVCNCAEHNFALFIAALHNCILS